MTIEEMIVRKRELGFSYKEISQRSGVPLGTVQKIFGGITRAPRMETILALERVLRNQEIPVVPASQVPTGVSVPGKRPGSLYAGHVAEAIPAFRVNLPDKKQGEFTLEDYYALPEDRRVELIDGVIYDMAAPSESHQLISGELFGQLRDIIRKNHGSCRVFAAPLDVQLDKDNKSMVQPDILILCDRSQANGRGVFGAPDFIIEILSPSTAKKDMLLKLKKYMAAGVREYWIVDPEEQQWAVYLRQGDDILVRPYTFDEMVPVGIWEGRYSIDFPDIKAQLEGWIR